MFSINPKVLHRDLTDFSAVSLDVTNLSVQRRKTCETLSKTLGVWKTRFSVFCEIIQAASRPDAYVNKSGGPQMLPFDWAKPPKASVLVGETRKSIGFTG